MNTSEWKKRVGHQKRLRGAELETGCEREKRTLSRVVRPALSVGFGLLLALGCGSRVQSQTGGETGFWESCVDDAECRTGTCACGVCTTSCTSVDECSGGAATCGVSLDGTACSAGGSKVCLPAPPPTEPTSTDTTSTDCRGPGHYEAGKERSYLPCCDGLEEVFQLSAAYGDGNQPVCVEAPLRVYACVEGSCGDGTCEVGEDVPCGCLDDCPGAAWETTPAPSPTATGSDERSGTNPPCEGFTCEVPLRRDSAGSVEIQVEFAGQFCTTECGLVLPRIQHVESGLYVPVGRGNDCSVCKDAASTAECETPTVSDRTWDGSVRRLDGTCTSDAGYELECQTEPLFAPAGRYRAEFCSLPAASGGEGQECTLQEVEQRCEVVEFDYPAGEPVILRFDNTLGEDADAGR